MLAADGFKPNPLFGHDRDCSLPVGTARLCQLFQRFIGRLPLPLLTDLRHWIRREMPQPFQIGSMCSGTDSSTLCWLGFRDAVQVVFGEVLDIEPSFAAESDLNKRAFIWKVSPDLKTLFMDVNDLSKTEATCMLADGRTSTAKVASTHHVVAGFPCDDASSLNVHSSSSANMSCAMTGTMRTGSVLHKIAQHLKVHGHNLLFATLENVTKLLKVPHNEFGEVTGPSNAAVVQHILSVDLDMFVKILHLDPRMFGSPQVIAAQTPHGKVAHRA